ncbi:hypothetical protein [Actinomycetospora sp. NBC_00405]|uniref:hypothetical protein n=1 Tax=Actinomycetospora sp. NBC_00405 TaxID=2975952 RepID=UPI002E237129
MLLIGGSTRAASTTTAVLRTARELARPGAVLYEGLATVLGYVGADVVEAACARVPVTRDALGPDGLVGDAELRAHIGAAVESLTRHAEPS